MRRKMLGIPRVAQGRRSTAPDCEHGSESRRGCTRGADRRARPADHRSAAGERPRILPPDRDAARHLRSDRPRPVRAPDEQGHPAGGRRDKPARARVRAGPCRGQDVRTAGLGPGRDRALARGRLRCRHGRAVRSRGRGRGVRPSRAPPADGPDAGARGSRLDRDVLLPRDVEAALRLGHPHEGGRVTTFETSLDAEQLQQAAQEHLWLHFTRMGGHRAPIIVRGEGCYLEDIAGKRYLDALAGLFAVQIGYSYGEEMGQAALEQMRELPFYTNWSYAHPRAIELAHELAGLAPGDLNRVFFVSGGSEAVESAWKLARQYHMAQGERRWKAVARRI